MRRNCEVYWIRLPEHTNILVDGYIGITSLGLTYRYNIHKSIARRGVTNSIIARAIRKYGDNLVVSSLVIGDEAYCQLIENRLRPVPGVGWNIGVGGSGTRRGQTNSPDHIAKFKKATTGKKRSTAAIEIFRQNGIRQFSHCDPWSHPYVNSEVWKKSIEVHTLVEAGAGQRTVAAHLSVTRDAVMKLVSKIKTGWNPSKDEKYLAWLSSNNKE